jgi:hypothetical protein
MVTRWTIDMKDVAGGSRELDARVVGLFASLREQPEHVDLVFEVPTTRPLDTNLQ